MEVGKKRQLQDMIYGAYLDNLQAIIRTEKPLIDAVKSLKDIEFESEEHMLNVLRQKITEIVKQDKNWKDNAPKVIMYERKYPHHFLSFMLSFDEYCSNVYITYNGEKHVMPMMPSVFKLLGENTELSHFRLLKKGTCELHTENIIKGIKNAIQEIKNKYKTLDFLKLDEYFSSYEDLKTQYEDLYDIIPYEVKTIYNLDFNWHFTRQRCEQDLL